jgi:hypothetical protein
MEDDEVGANCSLFVKCYIRIRMIRGLYQFDDNQLDKVRSAIKNKQ